MTVPATVKDRTASVETPATGASLLRPLTIRGTTFRTRIAMSPMCQYCAEEGFADDWHLVHLGSRAVGGASLVMVEATAVVRDGRISPGDLGIWSDAHVEPLARIARFVKKQGSVPAIQLAHAGRKASCEAPWLGGKPLTADNGAWTVVGPSAIPFGPGSPVPVALTIAQIDEVVDAFEAAAKRALVAGFEVIELHAAHGYLMHEFLSPIANHRTDEYGGSLENRMRLALRVIERVRSVIPADMPLFMRLSATDWVEGGWDVEQSVVLARRAKELGVDLVDASSGAMTPDAKIPVGRGYQVPLARQIRAEAGILTGAVGIIFDPVQAEEIVSSGAADLVFLGRELLREPYWAIKAEAALGGTSHWPIPYGYAVQRKAK